MLRERERKSAYSPYLGWCPVIYIKDRLTRKIKTSRRLLECISTNAWDTQEGAVWGCFEHALIWQLNQGEKSLCQVPG